MAFMGHLYESLLSDVDWLRTLSVSETDFYPESRPTLYLASSGFMI